MIYKRDSRKYMSGDKYDGFIDSIKRIVFDDKHTKYH